MVRQVLTLELDPLGSNHGCVTFRKSLNLFVPEVPQLN